MMILKGKSFLEGHKRNMGMTFRITRPRFILVFIFNSENPEDCIHPHLSFSHEFPAVWEITFCFFFFLGGWGRVLFPFHFFKSNNYDYQLIHMYLADT